MSVVKALAAVMSELPSIGKDQRAAAQQGCYAYRGIEAITRAAQPLLAKNGIVFAPCVTEHSVQDIEVNGKPWTDTTLHVLYRVYGPEGDHIEVGPIVAYGRDNSDKGANKCMTQAFKYALLQVFCISDAEDDADGQTHEADRAPSHRQQPRPAPSGGDWEGYKAQHPDVDWARLANLDNAFVQNVLTKGEHYGSLTDKQLDALVKVLAEA